SGDMGSRSGSVDIRARAGEAPSTGARSAASGQLSSQPGGAPDEDDGAQGEPIGQRLQRFPPQSSRQNIASQLIRRATSLLTAMMAANPNPLGDLADGIKLSMMYSYVAGVYRRAGEVAKAADMDDHRAKLWRQWDAKLPRKTFVQRQLAMRSE